jgi:hypothetical protein
MSGFHRLVLIIPGNKEGLLYSFLRSYGEIIQVHMAIFSSVDTIFKPIRMQGAFMSLWQFLILFCVKMALCYCKLNTGRAETRFSLFT